ncbi:MAG: YeeE/YedE family protein [Chloroflexi bacterium]|nr:YeeE/YedE family protein [Chloroflexota bacterium]MCI0580206.1 YeeE/YedE family protein [Chloroflexota bacterium]MCI0646943.1 YeeE/YedE family protein [Chloroflexota bacterium]MCI0728698.1 YeeE/YedE family protein [Chloroflexota bacterium]
MSILLAIVSGLALGYVLERGDFCFHSALRGLVRRPQELDLFRAYLLALLTAVPLVQGLVALGWIEPGLPPFAWPANVAGGVLFGVGMVVAASCITGLFYKLGHGMVGTLAGLAGWAAGDLLVYRGPLNPWREVLQRLPVTVNGQNATVINVFGPAGWLLLAVVGLAAAVYLWRSPRAGRKPNWGWPALGLATGLVTAAAWLLARAGGADYTYGTSGVPSQMMAALLGESGAGGSPWIPVALVSIVAGAFLAAWRAGTLWVRGETTRRYLELAAGGLLMGIGAGIAGGCNLGHSLVGVPLLALGSITTTLAMLVGVFLASQASRIKYHVSSVRYQVKQST